ncbi:MAG: class I SAM-dependent rRNA methyltransferase [Phycisphaerales bacterium]|nr:class I SAM-dependent rRNA methyltransferase [Phycisphaerales bacterium]
MPPEFDDSRSRDAQRPDARSGPPADARSPWVLLRSASQHPFIYQKMVRQIDPAARPGDIVNVYDRHGRYFGGGLFNPRSQIVVRLLEFTERPIDQDFFRDRIASALELRRVLGVEAVTDAYRIVHSEGDRLSGLIVERFADCLVCEIFSLGMFHRREMIARVIAASLGPPKSLDRPDRAAADWHVFYRADRHIEEIEGFNTRHSEAGTTAPPSITIREHGIRYSVDVITGHKTGFFCDQRDNRLKFARLCGGASVLDLCCYTGGFGLCAKKLGHAKDVTSVDLDEAAIAIVRQNQNLNQLRYDAVHADAFPYLRQMAANDRQYDCVVLDPPKFATSRREVDDAMRRYYDLNRTVMQVVRTGGVLLTCSCSGLVSRQMFTDVVAAAARDARRTLQIFDFTGAAGDHPVLTTCPESEYLKALWARVL